MVRPDGSNGSGGATEAQGEQASLVRVALLGDPLLDLVYGFRDRLVQVWSS